MFDDDILESVDAELKAGLVFTVDNVAPYIQAIERGFPMAMNRIAWEKRPDAQKLEVFPVRSGERHANEVERRLESLRGDVVKWLAQIEPSIEVVWIGDDTDIGLKMPLGCLLDRFPALFALPQHSYVVPTDGSWCLNYVMEGELFYARSSPP